MTRKQFLIDTYTFDYKITNAVAMVIKFRIPCNLKLIQLMNKSYEVGQYIISSIC